ncbi:hypothetical protein AV530_018518 [Patagioenas fasciata monilis]|uniref:Uncharacterized protein n=1 Tax=Patagioenas fasciata monilis TaxID=372326 RepID=A0A1V4JS51_PATFA|nr:hypothetical protein AV530_018518 [Patagioenas fasciata monilis]
MSTADGKRYSLTNTYINLLSNRRCLFAEPKTVSFWTDAQSGENVPLRTKAMKQEELHNAKPNLLLLIQHPSHREEICLFTKARDASL